MLLSIDWDHYSGAIEHVFDSPLWGTPDREDDRTHRWRERARQRDTRACGWHVLESEFPLYGDPSELLVFAGVPTFVAWSHAHAWTWLERYPQRDVVNFDSHHDLYSLSGDPERVRPGNWAGRALTLGLMRSYACIYPKWHADVRVTEGHDLDRTWSEVHARLPRDVCRRMTLQRARQLPKAHEVEAVLLVQSPSWTSPAHDGAFLEVVRALHATELSAPYARSWE